MQALYNFFFIAMPYIALTVFLIGTIYRYRGTKFRFSSLSSEFLEGRKLFWGVVPFHWGISVLFYGHLIAFLFPKSILAWNGNPVRLLILEFSAFIFAVATLIGLFNLIRRRITNSRIFVVSSRMDFFLEILLFTEIFLGLWIALEYRWGSSWFSSVLSPYLTSIFTLNPQIEAVTQLPLVIQLHIIVAFLIFFFVPFTRLVHLLVYPLNYLWRPYQQVYWNWNRKNLRNVQSPWDYSQPKNT